MTKKKTVKGVVLKSSVRGADGKLVIVNRIGEFDEATAKEAVKRGKLRIHEAAKAETKPANDKVEAGSEASVDERGTSPRL